MSQFPPESPERNRPQLRARPAGTVIAVVLSLMTLVSPLLHRALLVGVGLTLAACGKSVDSGVEQHVPFDAGNLNDGGVLSDAGEPPDAGIDAGSSDDAGTDAGQPDAGIIPVHVGTVFVVMLENHDANEIYGSSSAPYLNSLMANYGYATKFSDVLDAAIPSEPHYVWLEAGTNSFSDATFTSDADASSGNSTATPKHLTALLDDAGVSWMSYQQGLTQSGSGNCPISTDGVYAAKHDPFVFFQSVSGSPPSKSNAGCAAHHKSTDALAADLSAGNVARYVLITPDLCHDMHGASSCGSGIIKAADDWLKANIAAVITYANAHDGVVFFTWDEPDQTTLTPFIVVGPHLASKGFVSNTAFNLSSVTKSLQRILGVSPAEGVDYLGHAADKGTKDLSEFFQPGYFP